MKTLAKKVELTCTKSPESEVMNMAENLAERMKPWGGLNVIAPNLNVHVYWGQQKNYPSIKVD